MKALYIALSILLAIAALWIILCQALTASALIKIDEAYLYSTFILIGAALLLAGAPLCYTKFRVAGLIAVIAGALTIFITGSFIKSDQTIGTRNITFIRNQASLFIPIIAAVMIYAKKRLE